MNAIELAESIELTDCRADELETIYVAAKELRRLHAENESLRKYAGRYEWLRSEAAHVDGENPCVVIVDCYGNQVSLPYAESVLCGNELDAAIDAAMGDKK